MPTPNPDALILLALGLARFLAPDEPSRLPTQDSVAALLEHAIVADAVPEASRSDVIRLLPAAVLRRHVPLLIVNATNPSSPARRDTLWALGIAGGHEPAAVLESILQDRSNPVPIRADAVVARAMASTHDVAFAESLANSTEPELRHAARLVLGRTREGEATPRPASLTEWQAAVSAGGNPDRGRRLFLSPQLGCAKCHQAEGRGARSAPAFAPVSPPPSRAEWVEGILEPSVQIAKGYEACLIETRDEATFTGFLGHRTAAGDVVFVDPTGQPRRIPAAEVAQFNTLPQSLMPEGLAESMSVDDLRDLVAFLEAATLVPPGESTGE